MKTIAIRFTNRSIDAWLMRIMLALTLITVAGGFALFLDGGARPQGLMNAVERTGLWKYAEIAYIPISLLIIAHTMLSQGRYSHLREIFKSTGVKIAAIFVFMCALQWAAGLPISNAMISTLLSFVALSLIIGFATQILSAEEIFSTLNLTYFSCLLLSVILVAFVPNYGISLNIDEDWQGMFAHKNNLGIFCASYGLVAVGCWRTSRLLTTANIALAAALLLGSKSYASIAAFSIAALLSLSPTWLRRTIIRLRYPILAFGISASAAIVFLSLSSFSMELFEKDFTFSGRNMIWSYSLFGFIQHPMLGQGMNSLAYQVSHNSAGFFNATGQVLASHHNGMLALIYDFGMIGATAVLVALQRPLWRMNIRSTAAFMLISALIATIVLNTFEERLFSPNSFYFSLIILIFMIEKNPFCIDPERPDRTDQTINSRAAA